MDPGEGADGCCVVGGDGCGCGGGVLVGVGEGDVDDVRVGVTCYTL